MFVLEREIPKLWKYAIFCFREKWWEDHCLLYSKGNNSKSSRVGNLFFKWNIFSAKMWTDWNHSFSHSYTSLPTVCQRRLSVPSLIRDRKKKKREKKKQLLKWANKKGLMVGWYPDSGPCVAVFEARLEAESCISSQCRVNRISAILALVHSSPLISFSCITQENVKGGY